MVDVGFAVDDAVVLDVSVLEEDDFVCVVGVNKVEERRSVEVLESLVVVVVCEDNGEVVEVELCVKVVLGLCVVDATVGVKVD